MRWCKGPHTARFLSQSSWKILEDVTSVVVSSSKTRLVVVVRG